MGFYNAAAYATRHADAVRDIARVVLSAALGAGITVYAAVKFENVFAARSLMQTVYVLRYDGFDLTELFPFREFYMGGVGEYPFDEELVAVKVEKLLRVPYNRCGSTYIREDMRTFRRTIRRDCGNP